MTISTSGLFGVIIITLLCWLSLACEAGRAARVRIERFIRGVPEK